ncbi:MAG: ThiF family adenylyltransferase, partial [Myxococcota bacterium]
GCDNFTTRYLINDACVQRGLPNVHGSIYQFEGHVGVFSASSKAPCYRCLHPVPPPAEMAPNCAEAGVLGVLPGIIGTTQAIETLKLLLELGSPLIGRLGQYDARAGTWRDLKIRKDPKCPGCGRSEEATEQSA